VPGDTTQNGFTLQRTTSVSGPFTTVASIDNCAGMVTYSDTALTSSTTYYYQIQATSASNGSSGSSNVASAETDNTPTITYISPSYVLKGSTTPFTLTVNGSNFVSGYTVQVGGSTRTTTFVNASQLTASLTSTDLGTAAALAITVANGSSSVSNTQTLNVVANNTPTITSLSVSSLMEGSPAFDLTVNGTGFVTGSPVKIGGSSRTTTFYGPTELVAWIPATPDLATAANLAVTVANPSPGTTSAAATLAVDNPLPTITSIGPTTTATGAQFNLTVTGSGFVSGSAIMVGTHSITATFNPSTPTVLTATVPGADIPTSGTVNVTVVNSGPIPADAWVKVVSWVKDLVNALKEQSGERDSVFMLDCNPSFAIYTQLALVASENLVVPFTADDSSRRAIENVVALLYGIGRPDAASCARISFAKRAKEEGVSVPKLHSFVSNRVTLYEGVASRAFKAASKTIKSAMDQIYNTHRSLFADPKIAPSKSFVEVPDYHSASIVISMTGTPLNRLVAGPHTLVGERIQINPGPLANYRNALNKFVDHL
jgi:hypothetical protein